MPDRPPAEVPAWVRHVPVVTGTSTAVLGALVLLGWWRGFPELIDVLPSLPRMKANTALGVAFAGLSLLGHGRAPRWRLLALVPLVIGLVTLAEWVTGRTLGIDELLAEDTFTSVDPGRASPQLAIALALFGLARLAGASPRGRLAAGGGACTTLFAATALMLELGFLFQAPEITAADETAGMALASAAAIALLTGGLLATNAHRRPLTYLWHRGLTGTVTRRLLPAVVILPPVLGMVRLAGQEHGWYGLNFGAAAFTGSMVVVLAAVVTVTARTVAVAEAEATIAESALREAERRARYLADHDPLCQVWNRRRFERELEAALAPADPEGALLIIDVDHFKAVNDTLGHDAGDQLLVAVARALGRCVGPNGSVSRIGGDEFAVLLRCGRAEVERIAGDVVRTVRACGTDPRIAASGTRVSASIGVAFLSELGTDRTARSVLSRADEALYDAKRAGRGRFAVHAASPLA